MREIQWHKLNMDDDAIVVKADKRDEKTGGCDRYVVTGKGLDRLEIRYQSGPVSEGPNGIQDVHLLAIVKDHLEGFQSGPYECQENADALASVTAALDLMHKRTRRRIDRGVEGTDEA